MALMVEHPEVDKLVRELIGFTGESTTQVVITALQERLNREKSKRQQNSQSTKEAILRIGRECAALAVLDTRSAEEILGYDKHGLPN
ncbi:MAG: type II toxin-antitoxin system VapB family antitoxin [Caldilineaceae bacterium]